MPLNTPADDNVSPVGRVLVVEYVTTGVPPVDVNVSLNATFTVPLVLAGLVTVIVGQSTAR